MSFGQVGNGCLTVEHTHTDCNFRACFSSYLSYGLNECTVIYQFS